MNAPVETGRFDPAHLEKWYEVSRAYLAAPTQGLCKTTRNALRSRLPVILTDAPSAPREDRIAIIVVIHDEKIIPTFTRIYRIRDGKTHEEAGEGEQLNALKNLFIFKRILNSTRRIR